MDHNVIYEYILSRVCQDLEPYGFKRSGKGRFFYRYTANGKVGCMIEMQKSLFNSSESFSFTFNLGCIALYELSGYDKDKLTLELLKRAMGNPYGGIRIGQLCRGGDYWWEISDEIRNTYTIEEYYNRFIQKDMDKAACYLMELAAKKESVYH